MKRHLSRLKTVSTKTSSRNNSTLQRLKADSREYSFDEASIVENCHAGVSQSEEYTQPSAKDVKHHGHNLGIMKMEAQDSEHVQHPMFDQQFY